MGLTVKTLTSFEQEEHTVIGCAIVEFARLELAMDEFIIAFHEQNDGVSRRLSTRFPQQFDDKLNYVAGCFVEMPSLRSIPMFSDGSADYSWLWFTLSEVFEVRNHIAHGALTSTIVKDEGHIYRFSKLIRNDQNRRQFRVADFTIGRSYLLSLAELARGLKVFLVLAKRQVDGEQVAAEFDRFRKEIQKTDALLSALGTTRENLLREISRKRRGS